MRFSSLSVARWRQFRRVDLRFHPRLTVITGANGAGKTTILNLIGRHFGWQNALISTPRRKRTELLRELVYSADDWSPDVLKELDLLEDLAEEETQIPLQPAQVQGPTQRIGSLGYSNGGSAEIFVPAAVGAQYQIDIRSQQSVDGLHIPSHRPLYGYQPLQNIPTVPPNRQQLLQQYTEIVRQRYYGQHHQWTPNYFIKQTLVSLATFGPGNAVVEPNELAQALFTEFEKTLSLVLPPQLGFRKLAVRIPEVVLVTGTGEFSLDAVSGGIASIIDLAWQLFMYASPDREFVVTLDEPENHLHPELQRNLLPSLLNAFPHVQFIIATHNPFMVTAVPDSNIYVLQYDRSRRVKSAMLDMVNRAGSSNDVLRNVLGLEYTIPVWVERHLEALILAFADRELTDELLTDLRARLAELGLSKYLPTTVAQIARGRALHDTP